MNHSTHSLLSWMRDTALPYWAHHGIDRKFGGFAEELGEDGRITDVDFKRVRVQGRQLFTFSMAAALKWSEDAAKIAEHGYKFLKHAWNPETGCWASRLSREGQVIDRNFDLYDNAFVILGLASYYRVTHSAEALDLIEKTRMSVQKHLFTPYDIGYRQSPDDHEHLRQNPNMHWLEAMLWCYETTKIPHFLDEAAQIYRLAEEYIIDLKSGALREIFDNQWEPVRENGKILVEPGHHYEWAWLLNRTAQNGISVHPALIGKLLHFADSYGVNAETGLVYDQVSDTGEVTMGSTRLWPLTEAIKAWLIRADKSDTEKNLRVMQLERLLLERYLNRQPAGCWGDRLDSAGNMQPGRVPASSMYHLMMAAIELQSSQHASRFAGGMQAFG